MPDKKDFPKLNTQARVDFYKKNNLKMDATTELPKEKAVKTKPTPKTRKKPTANEMKADGTNVSKVDLKSSKRASDNNAIDLYEDARDGMRKTRLKIQQQGYDKERREIEDKEKESMTMSQRNKYDADKTTKAIKDYQLSRKDNQSMAKMMKKVKNSFSSSPSKMNDYSPVNLTFQPKNLNQHLQDKPSYGGKASETTSDLTGSETPKDGDVVLSDKEKTLKIIGDAKSSALNPK